MYVIIIIYNHPVVLRVYTYSVECRSEYNSQNSLEKTMYIIDELERDFSKPI